MKDFREYDFPNARLRIYRDGKCLEFPKWCVAIHVERDRAYVARALQLLRQHRRGVKVAA